jgi:thiamine kinase-like enzyme
VKTASSITTPYRDNANLVLDMTLDVNASNVNRQIWSIVRTICPFLDDVTNSGTLLSQSDSDEETISATSVDKSKQQDPMDGIAIEPLTGGLSNELFVVQTSHPQGVLVRIHPSTDNDSEAWTSGPSLAKAEQHSVVDRETENKLAAWLSAQGIAPIYYGRFTNGRVEEFYPNMTTLSWHEMPTYAPQIARLMADFHRLPVPDEVLTKPINGKWDCESCQFAIIDGWLDTVKNLFSRLPTPKNEAEHDYKEKQQLVQELAREWAWLKTQLADNTPLAGDSLEVQVRARSFFREVVLTHQDCQSLNVLRELSPTNASNSNHNFKLIDFEYAGWNPRAADIANTFCEYCDMNNLRANFETEFPSEQNQNVFLQAYVQRVQPSLAAELSASGLWEPFLATARNEVGRFTLQSHLGWAIWSVVKRNEDSIDFDYLAYAAQRMAGYRLFKSRYY